MYVCIRCALLMEAMREEREKVETSFKLKNISLIF